MANSQEKTRIEQILEDPTLNFDQILHTYLEEEGESAKPASECRYHDINEINQFTDYKYKALHLNIHSIPQNIDKLKIMLTEMENFGCSIDFILICETWLTDRKSNLYALDGYTRIEKHRTNTTGGGVAIYIKNKYQFQIREDLSVFNEGIYESIFAEVTLNKNKSILVGEIYRLSTTSQSDFMETYDTTCATILSENKDFIIGSDSNLDLMKLDTDSYIQNFLDCNFSNGITPVITKPTRVTHSTATLIDNIFTTFKDMNNYKSGILVTDISDHFPVFLFLEKVKGKTEKAPLTFTYRDNSQQNLDLVKNDLTNMNWNFLQDLNTDDSFQFITDTINTSVDKHCPMKTVVIPYTKLIHTPWMTTGLMKSSKMVNKLYKKALKHNKDTHYYENYKRHRNLFNQLKRKAKHAYFKEQLNESRNNIAKTWKVINKILGKVNDKSSLPSMFKVNGTIITDKQLISEGFCNYFTNVGPDFAAKIPKSKRTFLSYMKGTYNNSIFLEPTDQEEIFRIIMKMPSKKSCGYDGISSKLLKSIANQISYPLAIAINKSLENGEVPNNLKIAKVVPIYKSKDNQVFSNYRPISLLPNLSKILEKVMYKRIYNYFINMKILYPSQYGFRKDHSTVHAITELINDILNGFENKQWTLGVFLDLSKAFDTIDHDILLQKLSHYGIRGVALEWVKSYLSERKQYVEFMGVSSNQQSMICGVPQGSVLGPLLFIIYTNDLSSVTEHSKSILYADDSNIFKTGNNLRLLFRDVNKDLDNVAEWFKANKLSLNVAKTHYMLFQHRNNKPDDHDYKLTLCGNDIQETDSVKFLGLFLDPNLEWTAHIRQLETKLSRSLYMINSVKEQLDKDHLKILYYSTVYSHLNYGILHWSATFDQNKKKLDVMQNKCIRTVTKSKYNETINPLLLTLKTLKIEEIADFEMLKFVYDFVDQKLPSPLLNIYNQNFDVHDHDTRHARDPHARHHNYEQAAKSFIFKAPDIWSKLPPDIRHSVSREVFARKAKQHLLKKYD